MRLTVTAATLTTLLAAGCSSGAPQPQRTNVVNATHITTAAPQGALQPGVPQNIPNSVYGTPASKSPGDLVSEYARLLEAKDFSHAYNLWDPNSRPASESKFEEQFSHLKTIDAAVGKIGRTEGAAGSLYSEVQLTLSGTRDDGQRYTLTGPVTLRRVNDVPGSTPEQRQWHIVKMELTANPAKAEKLVTQH